MLPVLHVCAMGVPERPTPIHGDVRQGSVKEAQVSGGIGDLCRRGSGFPGLWAAIGGAVVVKITQACLECSR